MYWNFIVIFHFLCYLRFGYAELNLRIPLKSELNIEIVQFLVFLPHLYPQRFPENFGRFEQSEVRFPLGGSGTPLDARGRLNYMYGVKKVELKFLNFYSFILDKEKNT